MSNIHTISLSLESSLFMLETNGHAWRRPANNGKLYLGNCQLSTEGEGEEKKRINLECWCEEQQEEIKKKKKF